MELIFIILSWMILLVPGFDDSVPPTDGKIFKIETSPDIVQSIKPTSDEYFDFTGMDIELKQNATGLLEIKIPKNLPTPASLVGFWAYDGRPIVSADGTDMNYDLIEDPCYFRFNIPIEDKANVETAYLVITAGTWQLYSPIQFEKDDPCYNEVFYKETGESNSAFNIVVEIIQPPLKSYKSGIPIDKITCKENLILVTKYDGSPACVKPETKIKLIERGWARSNGSNLLTYTEGVLIGEDEKKIIQTVLSNTEIEKLLKGKDYTIFQVRDGVWCRDCVCPENGCTLVGFSLVKSEHLGVMMSIILNPITGKIFEISTSEAWNQD
jgi:hypothetical protein